MNQQLLENPGMMQLMQQMGVFQNPMEQLGGLMQLLQMQQGMQAQQQGLNLDEQKIQMAQEQMEYEKQMQAQMQAMQRAQMMTSLLQGGNVGLDPNAVQQVYGAAQFPTLGINFQGLGGGLGMPQSPYAPDSDSSFLHQDINNMKGGLGLSDLIR